MINYENKIYSLIRKSVETKVIAIKPSIDGLNDEELANSKQIYIVTLDDKEYPITFNPNFNIRAVNKNGEILKIGCKLLKELIDNKIFNEFNILVVPEAEFNYPKSKIEERLNQFYFDKNESPDDGEDKNEPIIDPAKYETISVDYVESNDSDNEYKIQLGFSIELEDNFDGSLHIETKYGKCSVIDEDGKIVLDCNMIYNPNDLEKTKRYDEVTFESAAIKKKYVDKIKAVTDLFLSNDVKLRESNKRKLLEDSYKYNDQVRDYIQNRYNEAKMNGIPADEIEMNFNILPVSISLNKVQKKPICIVVKKKKDNPDDKNEPEISASFEMEVEPTKITNFSLICPHCKREITSENKLELLRAEGNTFVVGCSSCGQKIDGDKYLGQLFLEEAIKVDLSDPEHVKYYIDDCKKCDIDHNYYPTSKMIKYSFLAADDRKVESGYCFNDDKHCRVCKNCHAIIAGTVEELDKYFYKEIKGKDFVCCNACVNEKKSKEKLRPQTPYDIVGRKPYYLSEISNRVFLFDKNKNNIEFYLSKDTDDSNSKIIVGSSLEFKVCSKCGQLVPINKYDKRNKCCFDCKGKSPELLKMSQENFAFFRKHINEFYPQISKYFPDEGSIKYSCTKNVYNEIVYRYFIENKLLVIVYDGNEIIFSRLSNK